MGAPSLRASIVVSVLAYLVAQAALYTTATLLLGSRVGWVFYAVTAVFHALILAFLLWRRGDLRRTTDGSALDRVNLPCHLTLLRLSSTPTIIAVTALRGPAAAGVAFLVLVAAVFATDFWDGRIARSRGETTVMGSYLDSSSDYVILAAVGIAYTAMSIIPPWFAAVLLARLGIHAAGMGLVSLVRGRIEPETTFLGKAGVFAAMVAVAFQLARWYGVPGVGHPTVVTVVEIAAAALLMISLGEKILYLARKLREKPRSPG